MSDVCYYQDEVRSLPKNLKMKAARAQLDMTQKDLAAAVGVSRQTINAIENDKYDPTLSLAFSLARELQCSVDGLFQPSQS